MKSPLPQFHKSETALVHEDCLRAITGDVSLDPLGNPPKA
jgi:hypothetical protein